MPATALPPLPAPVEVARIDALAAELAGTAPQLALLREDGELARLSRDFHDYSPVLTPLLAGCRAQLAARPTTVEQVLAVASACARHGVPLTVRGAGTGNYGQCVPLAGGLVLDLSGLNRVREIDPLSGVLSAEAGCLLGDLETALAPQRRQLRLVPSTVRSATLGGFIAGGSGGIGSLRWGFLRDPGNLLGLEMVTLEPQPRLLQLDAAAAEPLNHAYGSNGILTAVRLATAEAVAWRPLVVGFHRWQEALAAARELPATALLLNTLCLLEAPVAARLPWPQGCSPPAAGEHRLLLLAAPDCLEVLPAWLERRGGSLCWQEPAEGARGVPLRELSWNHTTLHWRAQVEGWTYLQMLLPEDPAPLLEALRQRWGEDLLWHLEGVRQAGAARLAALPLLRWQGLEPLRQLMEQCREGGALLFDPHVFTVEDGGLGVIDADMVAAKAAYDPAGLLNPGKLRGWSLSRTPG
ncbi:MAG: FAD-binding oxidoreductase [Cyanobium sp.]